VGLATIRSHIKRIYMKLGVRRQAELMLRVSALMGESAAGQASGVRSA
jgi:DNA-binding NarL/FixJ family response regulator